MTAEELTAALENLPPGEPWAEAHRAAEAAIVADLDAADAAVFSPDLEPTSVATIEQYRDLCNRTPASGYRPAMTTFHGRSLNHPELARCFRSPECLADVGDAAARTAVPHDGTETFAAVRARAAAAEIRRYKLDIARQLAAADGHPLADAARRYVAAENLGGRLKAARVRHEEYARAELERIEAEQRAAAAAVVADRARRVAEAKAAAQAARLEAQRTANEARLVRAAALQERLRERLELAKRAKSTAARSRLEHLETRETLHDVASVITMAPSLSEERLRLFEAVLDHEGA